MGGLDSDDTEASTDKVSSTRTLAVFLIMLLLLSPGFLMTFAGISPLNPIVMLAMWVLILPVVLLLVTRIHLMRSAGGSDAAKEDDAILLCIQRHASRATRTAGSGKFCCSYCETVFDLMDAVPVEPDVFLCPKCGTRLVLE